MKTTFGTNDQTSYFLNRKRRQHMRKKIVCACVHWAYRVVQLVLNPNNCVEAIANSRKSCSRIVLVELNATITYCWMGVKIRQSVNYLVHLNQVHDCGPGMQWIRTKCFHAKWERNQNMDRNRKTNKIQGCCSHTGMWQLVLMPDQCTHNYIHIYLNSLQSKWCNYTTFFMSTEYQLVSSPSSTGLLHPVRGSVHNSNPQSRHCPGPFFVL